MTFYGKLISFFPALNVALVLAALIGFITDPGILYGLEILFFIYFFPLICFHLHQIICPLKEGKFDITSGYSAWYGTHMIQNMHITFPMFERVLRLIPGVFSAWLRLWGSDVGKNIHWTTQFEVFDRSLLKIGDNCVFGYEVKVSSHVVMPSSKHGMIVYVKHISIGNNSFIGAATRMTPGVIVEERALVPAKSDLYPNTVVEGRKKKAKSTQVSNESAVLK